MKNSKGFSLLELLVVIAILGILVAIALPRYFDAVADAKRNAQKTNIAIIRTSLEFYRNKNNTYPTTTASFVGFLGDQTYFSETPVCPYNNQTYTSQGSAPSTWTEGNAHILVYVGSARAYTLTYTAP
ncbi:MAG: prepilin-type N-terminal cleavage/methylation domain-containing protein [Dictyoglomus sp.]|nr:prepilin-type N-terminal cleavage/methylation domain-containing protein [Dictyoglomus sp.]MDW8188573.1 prepilin-type N-terminal cleavage/methylation domain-containing protein [Dictyoglomus sp.]